MTNNRTHNLPEQKKFRRKLRHQSTAEENALWQMLKSKRLNNSHWYRQFSVGPYVLDFYCPAAKLCVEVDGLQHQTEEGQKHDEIRSSYLAKEGIEVLRVPNGVVWNGSDIIASEIIQRLEERLK